MEYIFPPWKLFIRINSSVSSWLCKQTLVAAVPAARYRISSEILSIPVSKPPPCRNLVSTTCFKFAYYETVGPSLPSPPLPSPRSNRVTDTWHSFPVTLRVVAREQGIICGLWKPIINVQLEFQLDFTIYLVSSNISFSFS